jgi:hypothetical protein
MRSCQCVLRTVPLTCLTLALTAALLAGCVTGGGKRSARGGKAQDAQLEQIKRQCDVMKKIKLAQPPIQTPVDARMVRVREALLDGKRALAMTRAWRLANECKTEARHRQDLSVLSDDIAQAGARISPESVERFNALCRAADYSNAIMCGEVVLAGRGGVCAPPPLTPASQPQTATSSAPAGGAGTGTQAGEEDEEDEESEEDEEAQVDPSAPRAFRMLLSLGVGVGSAALGGVHRGAEDISASFNAQNPNRIVGKSPTSGVQVNSELSLRYYFPYHLLAQVGLSTIYNSATSTFGQGGSTLANDNLGLEIPLLVGAYYTLAHRIDLYAAVGPSFLVLSGSYWTSDPGFAPDFEADTAVGAHFVVGADLLMGKIWALGLDLRYRLLNGGELKDRETGETLVSGDFIGDGSTSTYDFDLSGFSAAVYLRFFVL